MTLYETIFLRRAVRKYNMAALDASVIADIRGFIDNITQMEGQSARFEIVEADKVNNSMAPHYILAYCEETDSALANVGFCLQAVDLYIQSIGLGSLWLGMAKPNSNEANYCIMLAFGATDVPLRKDDSEFDRVPLSKICGEDNKVSRAVRLAPSAINTQPWKLEFQPGKVFLEYFGRGAMKLIVKKKLAKIDLGIATRHAAIALEHEGRTVQSVKPVTGGKAFGIEVAYSG